MKTIGDSAFAGCTSLTSITIPDSVTTIGNHAFSNCTSLTSITIPDSVTSIGDSAFYNTGYTNDPRHWEDGVLYIGHHLIDADEETYGLPQNVTVHPRTITIAGSAFAGCISLTSVTIGNSVTTIGDSAFYNCTSLTSIIIPDSVTAIGNEAFYDCSSLTSITIPDSVTSIGSSVFYNTGYTNDPRHWEDGVLYIGHHLIDADEETYDLPQNVTIRQGTITIADGAFGWCGSLTSVTIPDSVVTIGDDAFYWCTSLISIVIPNSVTTIGDRAFACCTSLISVNIGQEVTVIDDYAFYWCSSLTSMVIPASVIDIGEWAFGYWTEGASIVPIPGFTVSGFTGTAAEEYANANSFAFIALDSAGDSLADVDTNGDGGDGEISAAEAQAFYIGFYDALTDGNPPAGADVSGDGRVDIEDVLTVYLIASGRA